MKYTSLVVLTLLSTIAAFASSDASKKVSSEAQRCADAVIKADYDTLVWYTHSNVIEMMGGKAKMIEVVRAGMSQMHAQGIEFVSATVGEAEEPRTVGDTMISIVPQTIVMKAPGAKITQESSLLGISSDNGETWAFIDLGPITKAQFRQVFPELADHVTLPPKKKPVVEEA